MAPGRRRRRPYVPDNTRPKIALAHLAGGNGLWLGSLTGRLLERSACIAYLQCMLQHEPYRPRSWSACSLRSCAVSLALSAAALCLSCASTEQEAVGHGGYDPSDAAVGDGAADGGGDGSQCVPKTCAQLGATCGSAPNGCGGKVTCGSCPAGQACGGGGLNKCGTGSCAPKGCAQLGASCGWVSDGCSEALDCGNCPPPLTCGGTKPNQCGCSAKTCAQLGVSCGAVPDACQGKVECGACASGQTCGGGGIANQCGAGTCSAKTCSQLGTSCGLVSDGCSQVLDCGACTPPATCGGAGKLNQCGCTPRSCSQLGISCGEANDGCGKQLDCGTCTMGQTCGGAGVPGQCGCTADTHPDTCAVASATQPAIIPIGGEAKIAANLIPDGDKDWWVATFDGAGSCSYHPRVSLLDLSDSGLVRIVVQTSCGTHLECGEGGTSTSAEAWEFTWSDTCGEKKALDPSIKAATPTTIRVGVFATGSSTGCLPYELHFAN